MEASVRDQWATKIKRGFRRISYDMTKAMWVGAPIPAGIDWAAWKRQTPKCCAERGFSGGPSPTWPHADHIEDERIQDESFAACAFRLAAEAGYEIPMTEPIEGRLGWEERLASYPPFKEES